MGSTNHQLVVPGSTEQNKSNFSISVGLVPPRIMIKVAGLVIPTNTMMEHIAN